MINFTDIIKGKFLEEFSAISLGQMVVALALAFVLGLFIVHIYKLTFSGVSFSRSFAACLIMLTMVTALVIQVITSNIILSLGMVGALSIVRFRTAVKEPTDTAFLFWAIATGILCGAGYVTIAIISTLLLGLLFTGLHVFSKKSSFNSFVVVTRFDENSQIAEKLSIFPRYQLKNLTVTAKYTELVADIQLRDSDLQKISALRHEPGVHEITVMRGTNGSIL